MNSDYYSILAKVFHRHYKDIKDERFIEAERQYKEEISSQAWELLSKEAFQELLEKEEYKEILFRLRTLFNKTRFTNWRDSDVLRIHKLPLRPFLCQGIYDLLFSERPLTERIDALVSLLDQEEKVTPSNKWNLLTYLLFFYYPKDFYFIKPTIWDDICNGLGLENPREVNMTGESYGKILKVCQGVMDALKGTDLEPRDMIDLHSLFNVCFK